MGLDKKEPPLVLINHVFTDININANLEIPAEELKDENFFDVDCSTEMETYQNNEDPRLFKVILTITNQHSDKTYAYNFKITIHGFFRIIEDCPEDKWGPLIEVLAPSILYTSARDFLYTVSSRGPYPGIYLPTVSFLPNVETKEQKEN